jgi:hypothetical protein
MYNSDSEIWEEVKKLKGTTLYTYVEKSKNTFVDVEDSGRKIDRVIILERETFPTKEDVIAAYKFLVVKGSLKRTDLEWLAAPEKQVSSIVFRIIGEISKDQIILDNSKREPIINYKKN